MKHRRNFAVELKRQIVVERQFVSNMEPDVIGELFSAAGQGRADTEEVWRNADTGRTDGFGSHCTNGG
jgi:hypothetical protein